MWGNYHSCTLSSTKWHDGGWKVAGSKMPFVFSEYDGFFLHLDPAENTLLEDQDYSERAFHIYLMGHDAVADHQICFSKANNGTWNIGWTGKIAQVYIGDYDLDYRFSVNLTRVQFSGFTVPLQLSDDEACTLFEQSVSDFSQWKLLKDNKNSNHRFFLPIELS